MLRSSVLLVTLLVAAGTLDAAAAALESQHAVASREHRLPLHLEPHSPDSKECFAESGDLRLIAIMPETPRAASFSTPTGLTFTIEEGQRDPCSGYLRLVHVGDEHVVLEWNSYQCRGTPPDGKWRTCWDVLSRSGALTPTTLSPVDGPTQLSGPPSETWHLALGCVGATTRLHQVNQPFLEDALPVPR